MRFPSLRFTPGYLGKRIALLLLLNSAICLLPGTANARISLEVLRRDGYGMVELQRPEPNTLTVSATINGRKARLIVDTGWPDEGMFWGNTARLSISARRSSTSIRSNKLRVRTGAKDVKN